MSWLRRRGASAPPTRARRPRTPPDELDARSDRSAGPLDISEVEPSEEFDPPSDRTAGPLDISEVDDDAEEVTGGVRAARVDLGALLLPAHPGMELRLEVEEGDQRVVAVTVVLGESAAQVQAFAAPRSQGIWRAVRAEIATSVAQQGGSCEEVAGDFGPELLARVPGRTPDGLAAQQLARFLGVDGPRWFLRAVLSGPAADDPGEAAALLDVLRGTVVVRGSEAMAPRDLLELRLPRTEAPGAPETGLGE